MIKSPVLHLLKLKLRVLFNFILSQVNESSKVAKIFLKKKFFKLCLRQKSYLVLIFILVLVKTNLLIKKRGSK